MFMLVTMNNDQGEEILGAHKIKGFQRFKSAIFVIAAFMMASGQWNDVKELYSSLYDDALAKFTNSVEYELIDKINVGNGLEYTKIMVGEPKVIKRSRIDKDVLYYYYLEGKYDLILLSKDERIVGYSILVKETGFTPNVPFSEALGSANLANVDNTAQQYYFDVANLIYFIESKELDKQQMFLNLVRGYVEYGAIPELIKTPNSYKEDTLAAINTLDMAETFNDGEISNTLKSIRTLVYPNFYGITELDPKLIADALLTRYEYQLFTKS
jgi:hypothetical protein